MRGWCVVCDSCGKNVEHHHSGPPCEGLKGWLAVSYRKGCESVDHYSFCSISCLKEWVDSHATRIPDVFLKSFSEGEDST